LFNRTFGNQRATEEDAMSSETAARRRGKLAALAVAAAALGAVALLPIPASAQIYPGWDFGNGIGIGIGPPPSAYTPCPNYGWLYYPYRCPYRYYSRPRHHRHYSTNR
jgi:hypothetical protein